MSITVTNTKVIPPEGIASSKFETGKLYRLAKGGYDTIYIRATNGKILWFEDERVGIAESDENEKFILAPIGTQVLLKN